MSPATALCECSATTLGQMLASKEIDAVELTEHFIRRIEAGDDRTVFITTTFERARREAAASAERHRRGQALGALDGVPVAWKDVIDVRDTPTTAASNIYRDAAPASADAPVVAHLAAAGMVSLGKTNLSEFAYSSLGLNPHFGTPLNPHARDCARVPGGSSSGSGVAVGARLVPIAIGTDTGGSVRTPAAFNGVVGYKTSELRFDRGGVFPLSRTLDTIGVLAHAVSDCLLVDRAMRGLATQPTAATASVPLSEVTLVAPDTAVMEALEPEVERNFVESLRRLQEAGARVVRREVPELDELESLGRNHGFLASAEAYCRHHELLEGPRASEIDPFVFRRIMAAKSMSAYDLLRLQQERQRLRESLWASLDGAMLVMPTIAHVAPPLAPLQADIDYFARVNGKTIRNTMWANMLNMCGLALPNGVGQAQMPTSIAFYARAGSEDYLLNTGLQLGACVMPYTG